MAKRGSGSRFEICILGASDLVSRDFSESANKKKKNVMMEMLWNRCYTCNKKDTNCSTVGYCMFSLITILEKTSDVRERSDRATSSDEGLARECVDRTSPREWKEVEDANSEAQNGQVRVP